MQNFIPWAAPNYWGNEIKYVNEALESTWISGGVFVDKIEDSFSDFFNKKHALAVSNGTAAIHLAYLGLNLKPGDEVIVPGFGFMAASNIALQMGLKPVFAEVDPDTWCLSVEELSRCITSKTKTILPVHTYGNVCRMDEISELANDYGIPVIEDCAESLASKYKQKYAGTYGTISTFSFQATKTITTGEGGLVITEDEAISRKMKLYRSHGMDRSKKYYWHELPGHNFRLTNFQAAMGVAQFEKLDTIIINKQRVYEEYKKHLSGADGLVMQKFETEVEPVVWAVSIKLDVNAFPQGRHKVISQLHEKGIETRPGFYAASKLKIYDCPSLPVCEEISENIISLPSFPTLQNDQISYICEQLIHLKK